MKIAMWSGPRNLSTAMMYSFANRDDFDAMDEPFYAAYLAKSGVIHPMQNEILAAQDTDPQLVANLCAKTPAQNKYMKHMPHHMLSGFPLGWAKDCVNIHLLRHPARVIASYAAKRSDISLDDLGFRQQLEIFDALGGMIIDSAEIRENPQKALMSLCNAIELPFDPRMLSWKTGPRDFDGVWAKHWYGSVHASTGFSGAEGPLPTIADRFKPLLAEALPIYDVLADRALRLLAD